MRKFKDKADFDKWWAKLQAIEQHPRRVRKAMYMSDTHVNGNPTMDPFGHQAAGVRFASLPVELRSHAEAKLTKLLIKHGAELAKRRERCPQAGNFYLGVLIGAATTWVKRTSGMLPPFSEIRKNIYKAKVWHRSLRTMMGLTESAAIPREMVLKLRAEHPTLSFYELKALYYARVKEADLQANALHCEPPPPIAEPGQTNMEGI